MISSTLRGVEYLSNDGKNMILVQRIIKVTFNFLFLTKKKKKIDFKRIRKWQCDSKILFGNIIKMQYKRISYPNLC